jgi:hypothetical protein
MNLNFLLFSFHVDHEYIHDCAGNLIKQIDKKTGEVIVDNTEEWEKINNKKWEDHIKN